MLRAHTSDACILLGRSHYDGEAGFADYMISRACMMERGDDEILRNAFFGH